MSLSQETRNEIFAKIKMALQKHAPPMVVAKDKEDVFELIGNKPMPYGSKKELVPGIYFCSAVSRKDMVSFYFFPIYFETAGFLELIPNLKKCLKGKTCFNIKKADQVHEKELNALLKKGVGA
jgi:hypothetical protein